MLKDFSLKFIDVMMGVVLGVGFQWWPDLHEPWQYIAFAFVYLNLVDYWIDYSPALKKYPLKREIDVILHTFIFFSIFYLIFSTRQTIQAVFIGYALYRAADIVWIWRMKQEAHPTSNDRIFLNTWIIQDIAEITGIGILALLIPLFTPLTLILIFIVFRLAARIFSSVRYKKIYYD